jgi:WD40 repeat protein
MERPNSPPPPPPPSTGPSAMFKPPTAQEEVVANAPNVINKSNNNIPSSKSRINISSKSSAAIAQLPSSTSPRGVRLEKVVGVTATHNACIALNPSTREVAYPAGRTVVLHDVVHDVQTFHFHGSKTVSAITWSADGNIIAIGERGHQPGIVIWEKIPRDNCNDYSTPASGAGSVSPPPDSGRADKVKYQRVARLTGHTFGIKCMAFDKSGKYLVSVGFKHDHRIFVWDWKKEIICNSKITTSSNGHSNLQHSGENNIPNNNSYNSANAVDSSNMSKNSIGTSLKIDQRKIAVAKFTKRIHNIAFLDNYGFCGTSSIAKKEGKIDVVSHTAGSNLDDTDDNNNDGIDSKNRIFVTVADGGVIEYWVLNSDGDNNSIKTEDEIISLIPKAGSAPKAFHKSNFIDAAASTDGDLYTVTYDGNLCSFGKNGIMEKWVSLHATAYAIEIGSNFVVVGCADGLVRIFQKKTLKYIGTLPLPAPLLGKNTTNHNGSTDKGESTKHNEEFSPVKPIYPAALCVKVDTSDTYVTVMYANRQLTTWNVSAISKKEPSIVSSHLYHSGCIWDVNIPAASAARMHSLNNGNTIRFGGSKLNDEDNDRPIIDNAVITCSADGTIRFWDLERKKNNRLGSNNNSSGSSNSTKSSSDVNYGIPFDNFMLDILYADAKPSTLAPIPTANTTTATSPKSSTVDTASGLPLASSNVLNQAESNDNLVNSTNVTYDAELPPKAKPNVGVRCIDVSPDGRWLASGDRQGHIRVHDLKNMSEFSSIKSHDAEVLSISFCPKPPPKGLNGSGKMHDVDFGNSQSYTQPSLLASGGRDRLVKIYDVGNNFSHCKTLDNHSASVLGVKFALDGSRLLTCGGDRTIVISRVKTLSNGDKSVGDAKISTVDGCTSYDVVRDRSVTVPYGTIYDMNVHENNRWIVTAGSEKKVQVWSLFSGKRLRSWKPTDGRTGSGPEVELYKIKLDATGTYAATCSFDKQVRIYDFISGSCVARFSGHSELVTGVAFTADCRRLISVGGDGCIFVWRLPSAMTRAMRERREAKKVAVIRKKQEAAEELEQRKLEQEKDEIIIKSSRKKNEVRLSPQVNAKQIDEEMINNDKTDVETIEANGLLPSLKTITDKEIAESVSNSMKETHQQSTNLSKEPIMEIKNDTGKKEAGVVKTNQATKSQNISPPKSSKTNKMGEEANDYNLMIVGKAVTRHPQQNKNTNGASTQNTIESTVSTVNSTIASTSDLPKWAQTQGSDQATQCLSAVTEDLPAWAKTQGKKNEVESPKDASKETAIKTAKNVTKSVTPKREKDIQAVQALDGVIEDDSGDSSATELGDESLAAPLIKEIDDQNDEEVIENIEVEKDADSPPRPINTRSLAEERRALALRQRGQETNAAVADMRARLSALGILPVGQEKGNNYSNTGIQKKEDNGPKTEEIVEKVIVATTDISTDVSILDLSVDTSADVSVIANDKKLTNEDKSDYTALRKIQNYEKNSIEKPSIQIEMSLNMDAKEVNDKTGDKLILQPPKSSASPKRRESSKSLHNGSIDNSTSALRLSKPAEAYRASLANLRQALSHCVEMYKEVDFVRQSLPSVPERSGVEELLKEFQEEFKGIVSEIPQQEQRKNDRIDNDADGEEDSGPEDETSSSSEDDSELQMLLSLAKKLNKKKRKKKMLRSSGKLKRRSGKQNI